MSSLTLSLILSNKSSSVTAISARVRPRRSFSASFHHPGGSPLIPWERDVSSGQGDSIEFISLNWDLQYLREYCPVEILPWGGDPVDKLFGHLEPGNLEPGCGLRKEGTQCMKKGILIKIDRGGVFLWAIPACAHETRVGFRLDQTVSSLFMIFA